MQPPSVTSRAIGEGSNTRPQSRRPLAPKMPSPSPSPSQSKTTATPTAPRGHNSIANDLKAIFAKARPLVERWLDISDEFSALRDDATAKGIDWSQVKGLVKALAQDERNGDSKRVARLVEKADYASTYAKLLGLSGDLNEKKYFGGESGSAAGEASASNQSATDDTATQAPQSDPSPTSPDPAIVEKHEPVTGSLDSQSVDAPGEPLKDADPAASFTSQLPAGRPSDVEEESHGPVATTRSTGWLEGQHEIAAQDTSKRAVIPPPTFAELEIPEFLRREAEPS